MLRFEHVDRRFRAGTSLRTGASDLSFECAPGSISVLLGASGAGKSTALRLACGLERPDAGRILIGPPGSAAAAGSAGTSLGVLLPDTEMYGRLSLRENLQYYAVMSGLEAGHASSAIESGLDALGLAPVASTLYADLSSGERQRAALLRATIHHPSLLLIDEPTANVDMVGRRQMSAAIRAARDRGVCVLMSTHNLEEAAELADQVLVLEAGHLMASGSVQHLLRETATTTLADAFFTLTTPGGRACA